MKLIVLRHCEQDRQRPSQPLSPEGRAQAAILAEALAGEYAEKSVAVLVSKQARTYQTADLVVGRGVDIESSDLLFSSDSHPFDEGDAFTYVNSFFGSGAETVIVVTHLELAEALPAFVMGKLQYDYQSREFGYGQGVILDLKTGIYRFVP